MRYVKSEKSKLLAISHAMIIVFHSLLCDSVFYEVVLSQGQHSYLLLVVNSDQFYYSINQSIPVNTANTKMSMLIPVGLMF